MKEVILDTNFILTCIKQKIDFFEEIKLLGLKILIPDKVIGEIKRIIESKKKFHFREYAKLALKLLEKNQFKEINLGKKYVDKALINFIKKDKQIILATLDKDLKNKIQNPKLIIRKKKKLEII